MIHLIQEADQLKLRMMTCHFRRGVNKMKWKNVGSIYLVESETVASPVELRKEIKELESRIEAEKERRANKRNTA